MLTRTHTALAVIVGLISPCITFAADVDPGAFNPAISLVLSGAYTQLQKYPDTFEISGVMPGNGETGPGPRGFGLAESELGLRANIDPYFGGFLTAALSPDDGVEIEEAYIHTLALSHGLTMKAGRYLSSIGYHNDRHAHAWDFADAPLAYQAFFAPAFADDGVQVKWIAPLPTFVELGLEGGRGRGFPASDSAKNGLGASATYVHVGGDLGISHSWRAGLSHLRTSPDNRSYLDADRNGTPTRNSFSGTSETWLLDAVWKWAPQGNAAQTSLTVQAEYLRRAEDGTLTCADADSATPSTCVGDITDRHHAQQSGGYVQGVYQFRPRWRAGLRVDRIDYGTIDVGQVINGTGGLTAADFPVLREHNPTRSTLMLDYSPSEFSRLRLQFARDKSRRDAADNQVILQYQMSLGAHGAHQY